MNRSHIVAGGTLLAFLAATTALADYGLAPVTVSGITEAPVQIELDVSGVPEGSYSAFEIAVPSVRRYSALRWWLQTPGLSVPLADTGTSPDALLDPLPPTQTWTAEFAKTYSGEPLVLVAWFDTVIDTPLEVADVAITLIGGEVAPAIAPPAQNLGLLGSAGGEASGELASNGVEWVRFEVGEITSADCHSLRISTRGSQLTGGIYANGNDPELALYSAEGLLLATRDDIDRYFGDLQAALHFGIDEGGLVPPQGDLPAGTYFLAIAGYDAAFGWSHFEVMPDSAVTGPYLVTFSLDEIDNDCDANGVPDVCDVRAGAADNNSNGVPDACEDCNANGWFDDAEVAAGSAADCNGNHLPDDCDSPSPLTRLYVNRAATGDASGVDWANAIPELADALSRLPCGDVAEVWVAAGTYTPAPGMASRIRSFELRDGVAIYGGFAGWEESLDQRDVDANPTILSGDLKGDDVADLWTGIACELGEYAAGSTSPCGPYDRNGDGTVTLAELGLIDNSKHVVTAAEVGPEAVLDGVTVRGGYLEYGPADLGAGLLLAGSPTIRQCRFERNVAFTGGAVGVTAGSARMDRCTFFGNFAYAPTASQDLYANVRGAAVDVVGGAVTLTNCALVGNRAAVYHLFAQQIWGLGAGVHVAGGSASLIHCTVVGNAAGTSLNYQRGAGAFVSGGTLFVRNSIVWANRRLERNQGVIDEETTEIEVAGGAVDIAYCCICSWSGALGGVGNFSKPPRFADAPGPDGRFGSADDDYALTAGSPCVDAGSNGALPGDGMNGLDLAGRARRADDPCAPDRGSSEAPVADLGALEFSATTGATVDCDSNGVLDACDLQAGTVIFADDFNGAAIDPQKWELIGLAGLVGGGTVDPPTALRPCGIRGNANTVRTVPFDLGGQPAATVEMWVRNGADAVIQVGLQAPGVALTPVYTLAGEYGDYAWTPVRVSVPPALLVPDVQLSIAVDDYSRVDYLRIIGWPADTNRNGLLDACEPDLDGDGVLNADDVCDQSPAGEPVNPSGGPLGDGNNDCVVTLADYAFMEACLATAGPTGETPACAQVFDLNADGWVDLRDFAILQRVLPQ